MSGRPLEFDPAIALKAAMNVFWEKGYEATSMQDLLTAMQISKSSLYLEFGDKKSLFRQCLARYIHDFADTMRQQLDQADSGWQFISQFMASAREDVRATHSRRGCLVMNTASELAQRDADTAGDILAGIAVFRGVLERAVKRAQQEGDIPAESDAGTVALFIISSMSGLKIQAKAGADANVIQSIVDIILKAIRQGT